MTGQEAGKIALHHGAAYKSLVCVQSSIKGAYQGGFVHQMAHNIIVDRITGVRARARHTLHVFGSKFRIIALYYDGVVRTAEGWKSAVTIPASP
ncbi:hypothetical protein D3878_17860 [Noviherbaspirillum sedimenti]|uniref:Uncharacterized protein n=2 Tax=Noviherbaspirillum sedimenti TaxID=2320865 RepID=A0A3A3GLR5_9BURK|nr:hypothetical protein D3878_17860 [Noviherbaspirillum sedimenti]